MKKKILAAIAAAATVLPFFDLTTANAINFTMKNTINSESAILINLDCDTIIYEKNADTKQLPGPLVNIMTAVICLEECENLEQEVTVDESVYSDLYVTDYPDDLRFAHIENEDVLTYTDLLYAMMLTSSIEASSTIAYNIGEGSISAFVDKMNDKAVEIGMTNTKFTNPTGMYDPEQYTTARDMAILTQYALKVPHFETISSTYTYSPTVPNLDRHPDRESWIWVHSNTMMEKDGKYYYAGCHGIKTGNLEKGGRNIVTTAGKDGNNYLVVCMKSPLNDANGETTFYHLNDAETLLNWAFKHFSYQIVLPDTAELGELPVELADGNNYVLAKPSREVDLLWNDEVDISLISRDNITWYANTLKAPVKKGDILGSVTLEYSGEQLETVDLVAVSDVERSVSKYNLYAVKKFPESEWFKKAIFISIVLSIIYILICVYSYIIFKNNEKPVKPIYAVPKVDGKNGKKKRSSSKKK